MFQSALWLVCAGYLSLSLLAPGVVCVTTADNPGVRTVFTTKGVDYCMSEAMGGGGGGGWRGRGVQRKRDLEAYNIIVF